MIRATLAALGAHWRRHPLQLVTLLAGLALATGMWSAVQAINSEARAAYDTAEAQLGGAGLDELRAPSGSIALGRYVALRRAGWQLAPVLEGRLRLPEGQVTVTGIDPLSHPALPVFSDDAGALPPREALRALFARPETAAALAALPDMPPVTPSEQVPPGVVLGDISVVARILDRQDELSRLLVLPGQPRGLRPLEELAPDLIRVPFDGGGQSARLTESFHLNLTAFGLLSFAVGLFIVHGTIGLAFEQRRPLLRTLRALGVPLRALFAVLLGEVLALALLAGAAGLVLGWLVAAALLPDVAATLRGLYGAPVQGGLTLRPAWLATGLGMATGGALVASAQAFWRLGRMPVLAAPGLRAWGARAARGARIQAACGAGLALAGLGLHLALDGLLAGFALVAGMMLGAALMLPAALGLAVRAAQARAKNALAQWFWADLRAQLPGMSLALMALLLALAANIGVGTMVSSFRLTFTGWLDQRLAAEIYVTAASDAQAGKLREMLAGRVDAVLPIRYGEARLNGAPLRVYGVVDHATYRDNWPLLQGAPDVWDRVARGDGALVNELLARRAGLWTGARLQLGPDWGLEVVGVYSDYGNPQGQVIVSMDSLLAHRPDVPERQFGLRVDGALVPALLEDLQNGFDPPLLRVLDQRAIKAHSLAVFDKTFLVTNALKVLTLGVAGFAILTALLTLWSIRLPQLAPVWALGLTRAHLARLELLRSLALAGMTAVLALPLGLALAWALLAVINVEAFGWRLPMYLFPLDWLRLLGLALLAGFVAAALPARRLARLPPARLLGVFANER